MPRISIALLVLTLAAAAGCAPPAATSTQAAAGPTPAAQKSGVIRYADLQNVGVRDVPLLMALDALAAQGYAVQNLTLASNSLVITALAQGEADIGWASNQSVWTAISEGADVRTLAQSAGATAVVAAIGDIEACADLDARRVATPSTTSLNSRLLNAYVEQKCPEAAPQYIVLGEAASRVAALESGEIDAALVQSEELFRLERDMPGQFHALVYIRSAFPNVQIDGLHASRAWAEANPEIVKDFLRAWLGVHRQVAANPELLYAESARRLDMEPDLARTIGESYLAIGVWDPNGGLTEANLRTTLDVLAEYTDLPPGLSVDEIADLSYLNAVLAEIGRQ